jgi:hypothetical protein
VLSVPDGPWSAVKIAISPFRTLSPGSPRAGASICEKPNRGESLSPAYNGNPVTRSVVTLWNLIFAVCLKCHQFVFEPPLYLVS